MDDMTAVEHVQRHIRTNRKPRTALLTEVFGRGELTSSAFHQRKHGWVLVVMLLCKWKNFIHTILTIFFSPLSQEHSSCGFVLAPLHTVQQCLQNAIMSSMDRQTIHLKHWKDMYNNFYYMQHKQQVFVLCSIVTWSVKVYRDPFSFKHFSYRYPLFIVRAEA